jgi:hypothetical protein
MTRLSGALIGVMILSTGLSAVTPAFALGGCGPNRHRDWATGQCLWGGQNQSWCLRQTGHEATRMPNGTMQCLR